MSDVWVGDLPRLVARIAALLRDKNAALADEFVALAYAVHRAQDDRTAQLTRELGWRDNELRDRLAAMERRITASAEAIDMIARVLRDKGLLDDQTEVGG